MARLGLGDGWGCVFANDFDPVKAATYRANFADAATHFHEGDVWTLAPADLPGRADLAWASSPCQDFSLAGARAGPGGRPVLGLLRLLAADRGPGRRGPRAARHRHRERQRPAHLARRARTSPPLGEALAGAGLPLRRAGDRRGGLPAAVAAAGVRRRHARAAAAGPGRREPVPHPRGARPPRPACRPPLAQRWIWWRASPPPRRNTDLAALLEPDDAVAWHSPDRHRRAGWR